MQRYFEIRSPWDEYPKTFLSASVSPVSGEPYCLGGKGSHPIPSPSVAQASGNNGCHNIWGQGNNPPTFHYVCQS